MHTAVVLVVLLISVVEVQGGNSFYLAPSGPDGDGSPNFPFTNVTSALFAFRQNLTAGLSASLFILPGTYFNHA